MAGILLNRSRQVPAEETPAFGGIAERFRRAGDLDRSIALCREGLKRFPEQLSARVTLGWALLDKGQYDAAREELEQVLRKAPDNLAAIRGLAELHDRTEGAMAAEDEQSWRKEDAAATAAAAAEADATAADDRLAPIPVHLGLDTAEVVHTAAHAEQAAEAAAGAPDATARSAAAPVELEQPASVSMAGVDPAPFFAVEPVEVSAFDPGTIEGQETPVAFDAGPTTGAGIEIETPGAAALSASDERAGLDVEFAGPAAAFDASELVGPASALFEGGTAQFSTEVQSPDAPGTNAIAADEWAGLTSFAVDASVEPVAADTDLVTAPDAVLETGDPSIAFDQLLEGDPYLSAFGEADTSAPDAIFTTPEGLDDIDEAAGQDLAEAIRALEEAARRVEARLAPVPLRNEPAASAELIGAYDFGPDPDQEGPAGDDVREEASTAVLDTSHDGAFELEAPDLLDLSLSGTTDDIAERIGDQGSDIEEPVVDGLTLDFDAVVEDIAPVEPLEVEDQLEYGGLEAGNAGTADADLVAASAEAGHVDEVRRSGEAESAVEVHVETEVPAAASVDVVADTPVEAEAGFDYDERDPSPAVDATTERSDAESEPVSFAGPAETGAVGESDDLVQAVAEAGRPEAIAEQPVSADDHAIITAGTGTTLGALDAADVGIDAAATAEPDADRVLELVESVESVEWVEPEANETLEAAGTAEAPDASEPEPDEDEDDLPLAAMVATEWAPAPLAGEAHDGSAIAAPEPESRADVEPAPVRHVYDAPVFGASAALPTIAAEVSGLVADDGQSVALGVGQVKPAGRTPLAALERLLRKVQARQLELRGETVA